MHLTERVVAALGRKQAEYIAWDDALPGFGVRVKGSGKKTYVAQYRIGRRTRRIAIGDPAYVTLEAARRVAKSHFHAVSVEGRDPSAERRERRAGMTICELAAEYEAKGLPKKKPTTAAGYRILLRRWIVPALGHEPVAELSRAFVARWHAGLSEQPYQANRALALLSVLFTSAEKWGLRAPGTNPARGVDRYAEHGRDRFLNTGELARLGETLRECEQNGTELPNAIAVLRMLVLTGCRRGEVVNLTWGEVDLERGLLALRDGKTGRRTVHLGAPARELLASRDVGAASDLVFPGQAADDRGSLRALQNLSRAWKRIAFRAGLTGVRIHDLRHSFASVAAQGGASLPLIGGLLGHRVPATTARYAHLSADPLRAVAEATGQRIAAAMEGDAVTPLKLRGT